jgi:hypothetical protein
MPEASVISSWSKFLSSLSILILFPINAAFVIARSNYMIKIIMPTFLAKTANLIPFDACFSRQKDIKEQYRCQTCKE